MNATPRLDRLEPVAVNSSKRARDLVKGLAAGGGIGLVMALAKVDSGAMLWFFPALWIGILVHETGHLLAALLVGFHIRQFAVGPLVLEREARGWRLKLVPARAVGGMVQAAPPSTDDLRRRFLLFVTGGPAATALLFAATALLPAGPFTTALALANLILAGLSAIPSFAGGMASDGKAIQLLRRPSPDGDLLIALLYAIAQDTQDVAPRDWDPAMVGRLRAPGASPLAGAAATMLITYELLAADPDARAAAVEKGLALSDRISPDLRRICFDAAAWVQAFDRGRADPRSSGWPMPEPSGAPPLLPSGTPPAWPQSPWPKATSRKPAGTSTAPSQASIAAPAGAAPSTHSDNGSKQFLKHL